MTGALSVSGYTGNVVIPAKAGIHNKPAAAIAC